MLTPCVTYARVSSDEQAKAGFSIPFQREKLTAHVAGQGFEVVEHFEDVHSAKATGRPGFGRLLAYLSEHEDVKDVVVHRIDRLIRNHYEYGLLVEQMKVRVHSIVEPTQNSAVGRLMHGIGVVVAKYHSDNLTGEVLKGLRQRFEAGGCVTRAPVGYRNVSRTRTEKATVAVDDVTAPIVRTMFARYATGNVSLVALAEELYDHGLRTRKGSPYSGERIRGLLKHPFYAGRVRYRGEVRQGVHEPLVTEALWDQAQMVLAQRHADPGERGKHFFLLRGLLVCGTCGQKLTAEHHARGSYYRCTPHQLTLCAEPYVPVAELDHAIERLLAHVTIGAEQRDQVFTTLDGIEQNRADRRSRDEQRIRTQLAAADARLVAVTDKLCRGIITEAAYLPLKQSYLADQARLTAELAVLTDDLSESVADTKRILGMAEALPTLYRLTETPEERKTFLRFVFKRLVVQGREIVNLEFNPPFDLLLGETPRSGSTNDLAHRLLDHFAESKRNEAPGCSNIP